MKELRVVSDRDFEPFDVFWQFSNGRCGYWGDLNDLVVCPLGRFLLDGLLCHGLVRSGGLRCEV